MAQRTRIPDAGDRPAKGSPPKAAVKIPGTPVSQVAAFQWPTPPFFKLPTDALPSDHLDCLVEFMDGRIISGELVSITPDGLSAELRAAEGGRSQVLDLAEVRTIRLKTPVQLISNSGMINRVGAMKSQVADEKDFVVTYRDGKQLTGRTRGFRKERGGLFLFLAGSDPQRFEACFIPAGQAQKQQIGALLGEALVEKGLVDAETAKDAVNMQARLREQRLGEFLTEHAVVTPAGLASALKEQAQRPHILLGELLVEAGLISAEDLAKALSIQADNRGRRLGDILISMGVVSARQIQIVLSEKLGIPYVNVTDFEIDASALDLVSWDFAMRHQVLPLLRKDDSLVVAVQDPLLADFTSELQFMAGMPIIPVIGDTDEISARIQKEYGYISNIGAGKPGVRGVFESSADHGLAQARIEDLVVQLDKESVRAVALRPENEEEARLSDSTLIKLVNKIIMDAHAQQASDIHIESNRLHGTRIRFRKDGDLEVYLDLQSVYRHALVSRIKIMAGLDISEHRRGQDGKINFGRFGPLPIELRVSVIPTQDNLEDVVLRLLGGVEPLPLDELGMLERDITEMKRMVGRSYGLILTCGPTGSGKTTTLHSVLHHINRPEIKIWTAEDPIEISQPGLRQVQVNSRIGWTFDAIMRMFLRGDPDVIMVGEMRDAETAKMGIEASLTGHLVLSTLHTNSAAESAVRLLELGMDPYSFADSLIGILSQRLARKLCRACRKARTATESEITDLANEYCIGTRLNPQAVRDQWRQEYGHNGGIVLYEAGGCPQCRKGYRRRMGIYELLTATPAVKELIHSHGTAQQLAEAAQAGGMRLLRQDALLKVLRGDIDLISARAAFG